MVVSYLAHIAASLLCPASIDCMIDTWEVDALHLPSMPCSTLEKAGAPPCLSWTDLWKSVSYCCLCFDLKPVTVVVSWCGNLTIGGWEEGPFLVPVLPLCPL